MCKNWLLAGMIRSSRAHRYGVDYRGERRMLGLMRSKAHVRPWRMQMLGCLDLNDRRTLLVTPRRAISVSCFV